MSLRPRPFPHPWPDQPIINLSRHFKEFFGRFPVVILRGLAHGAWWSIYPYSAYWRNGGADPSIDAILRCYATLPSIVCWDIGAHYGIYAVGLARAIGPAGRVEAFEPDPVSYRRLNWHRRLNRLSHLHVHPVAASSTTQTARLYQYSGFGNTTSHLPFENKNTDQVPYREIATVALDEWVQTGRILPPRFIKIDVEGHAGPALEGMRRTLATVHPVILLAIHTQAEHESCRAILSGLYYSLQSLAKGDATTVLTSHFGELLCIPSPGADGDPGSTPPTRNP